MPKYKNIFDVDLKDGEAKRVRLGTISQGDALANRVGANVYDDGSPVTLTGTCFGKAVLEATGQTVPLTGIISGNTLYCDLEEACYSTPGPIEVNISLTNGSETITLLSAYGNVRITDSGTVIDPGTIIPSVSALIASINAAVATIPQDYSTLSANMNALTHFDLSISGKYIASTGVETANSDYSCTDYIPVNSDSVLILDGFWTGTGAYAYMFYNSSKAKISGENSITSRTVVTTIPSTAAYVRFSSRTSQGETPVAYVSNHVVEKVCTLTNGTLAEFKSYLGIS